MCAASCRMDILGDMNSKALKLFKGSKAESRIVFKIDRSTRAMARGGDCAHQMLDRDRYSKGIIKLKSFKRHLNGRAWIWPTWWGERWLVALYLSKEIIGRTCSIAVHQVYSASSRRRRLQYAIALLLYEKKKSGSARNEGMKRLKCEMLKSRDVRWLGCMRKRAKPCYPFAGSIFGGRNPWA